MYNSHLKKNQKLPISGLQIKTLKHPLIAHDIHSLIVVFTPEFSLKDTVEITVHLQCRDIQLVITLGTFEFFPVFGFSRQLLITLGTLIRFRDLFPKKIPAFTALTIINYRIHYQQQVKHALKFSLAVKDV